MVVVVVVVVVVVGVVVVVVVVVVVGVVVVVLEEPADEDATVLVPDALVLDADGADELDALPEAATSCVGCQPPTTIKPITT